jgi:hypothetical protein
MTCVSHIIQREPRVCERVALGKKRRWKVSTCAFASSFPPSLLLPELNMLKRGSARSLTTPQSKIQRQTFPP